MNRHQLFERQRESFARPIARRFITDALVSSARKIHLAAESAVLTFARDEVAAAPEWALGAIRAGASVSRHSTRRSYFGFPPRGLGADSYEGGAP
jgi:hypothetical protein